MPAPGFLAHLHPPRLDPERIKLRHTWCLGGFTFLCFLILAASGGVLMLQYVPTPGGAARFFAQEAGGVPFLWFFRNLHYLAGQAMVICLVGHMVRVVVGRAYLPPRASNWLVGLALCLLTLAMDFSGYLLRWDPATRAAGAVAANLTAALPGLGELAAGVFLAGQAETPARLLRLYVLHCLALPMGAVILTMYHFWRIRKDGRPGGGL